MERWKKCPKCKGNVLVDRDEYGWYELCIMCGNMGDLEDMVLAQPGSEHHSRHSKTGHKHQAAV